MACVCLAMLRFTPPAPPFGAGVATSGSAAADAAGAAAAAAASTALAASSLSLQQFLYRFPEPQWQGSVLPIFIRASPRSRILAHLRPKVPKQAKSGAAATLGVGIGEPPSSVGRSSALPTPVSPLFWRRPPPSPRPALARPRCKTAVVALARCRANLLAHLLTGWRFAAQGDECVQCQTSVNGECDVGAVRFSDA